MTETQTYTLINDLSQVIADAPTDRFANRVVYRDPALKAVVFAFAAGQCLPEHTAPGPVLIQILEGECDLTLEDEVHQARAGFWVRLPARLPHSLLARTPVKMLLLMLPADQHDK